MTPEESLRLHIDWWGKCRTCSRWTGDRAAMTPGTCGNAKSDMHGQETWTEGHCREWDTFDIEGAFAALDWGTEQNSK